MRRTTVLLFLVVTATALAAQTSPGKAAGAPASPKTPVTAADLRIAQRAADLVDAPEKWNHNDSGDCPAAPKTFSLYCALDKASSEVSGKEDDRSAVMQEARVVADLLAPKRYGARLVDYNNDPATTFEDMRVFFRVLQNRLTRRMAEEAPGAGQADAGEGASRSRPPVTEADVRIVQRARQILDSPAKWNRADTRVCPKDAATFSLYCALEKATQEVSGNFQHRGAAMQEARFVIEAIAPHAPYYNHRLMDFNNDPDTTFFDVQKFFQLLEERVAQRLAEQPKAAK